jgi:DNA-binding beta-propeller fold protein YncE
MGRVLVLMWRIFGGTLFWGMGAAIAATGCSAHDHSMSSRDREPLVTGKAIPLKWESVQGVGSLPMNLVLTPDGRYALTSDMGYYQSLWCIRASDGKGVSHVEFSNGPVVPSAAPGGPITGTVAAPASQKSNGLYYGLATAADGTIYAAQGAHDTIAVLKMEDGNLTLHDSIPTKHLDFPAGLALDRQGRLYVANNASGDGNPYKFSGSVAIYDPSTKSELGRYVFADSYGGTSNFPLGIAALGDGSKAYVAAERDDAVYVLDTRDPAKPSLLTKLGTGAHPVAVLLSADQSRLFVANSLSDTVSIISTREDKIAATVLLRPRMARDLPGVTPAALALSPDQKTLYAALSDMNAVAVIDVSDGSLRGYIPTGWYPTGIAVTSDGHDLLVANAKGTTVRNPNNHPNPHEPKSKSTHINQLLEGNVTAIRIPSASALEKTTEQVLKDNRLDRLEQPATNPLASIGLSSGKIKHVLYIVKENRTYDQILGDLPQGNGDPSLTLFGRDITPNQHALAERFVLLDNLYASGEVSGDGWDWSTQGMADAYVVRNIPYNYSHRGRKYDTEGENNGYPTAGAPATDDNGKPWSNPAFKTAAKPIPDVGNTGRNIWDAARDAGISFRNYGMFLSFNDRNAGVAGGPDNCPTAPGLLPAGHDLAGVTDIDYRRFDLDYADSELPEIYSRQSGDKHSLYATPTYGRYHAPNRFAEWNREFQMMLTKDPSGSTVPALMLIRLPEDHTSGAKSGKHTPRSYVADNDYALGQIVETVSRSAIWKDTAIFVIEDDAQSGVDHVDAHRTTGFIISPWIKAHSVDHHFYNTDSMLKTIELLLGLHPLCQYDAVADPILDWDSLPSNAAAFTAMALPQSLIAELNPDVASLGRGDPRRAMAIRSEAMDFVHPDSAPALELDEIVWHTVKGTASRMPAPRGMRPNDDD